MTQPRRGAWLLLLLSTTAVWSSVTPTLASSPGPASLGPFTRIDRGPVDPALAVPGLPAMWQAIFQQQTPQQTPQLADASPLLQPVPPRPEWQQQVQRNHGAPLRRWRPVRIDLAKVAQFAGRNPHGARLTLFPDVSVEVTTRRALVSEYALSWFGTADGVLTQSLALTWSGGRLVGSGDIRGRSYRVESLGGDHFALIELQHLSNPGCAGTQHPVPNGLGGSHVQ